MKKFLKTLAKKSMSLFMAVIMLMSCWVWIAPEKAEAAGIATNYGMTAVTSDTWGSTTSITLTGKSESYNVKVEIPSKMYLDKSEDLQSVGYKVKISTTYPNGYSRTIFLENNLWGGQEFGHNYNTSNALKGLTNLVDNFDGYGISLPSNCSWDNTTIDGGGTTVLKITNPATNIGSNGVYATLNGTPVKTGTYKYDMSEWPSSQNPYFYKITRDQIDCDNKAYTDEAWKSDNKHSGSINMEIIVYDKSELNTAIYNAENVHPGNNSSLYTEESWNTYTGALEEAKRVRKTREVNSDDITNAKNALATAISGLKRLYTVSFTDAKGTLSSVTCVEGSSVDIPAKGRLKAPDANGHYTFKHWQNKADEEDILSATSTKIDNIQGNVTYVAIYNDATLHSFNNGEYTYSNGQHFQGCSIVDEDGSTSCKFTGDGDTIDKGANCVVKWDIDENGNHIGLCDICKKGETPHAPVWEAGNQIAEEATCKHGNLYYKKCSECGIAAPETDVYDDGIINPDKHGTNTTVSETSSTCTVAGTKTTVCNDCGKTIKTETLPLAGHDVEGQPYEMIDGTFHGKKCKECGEWVITEREQHYMDDGVVTEPTCTTKGQIVYSCLAEGCSYTETEVIDELDHDFDESKYVEVKVDGKSYHANPCKECGTLDLDNKQEHTMEKFVDLENGYDELAPTCMTGGHYYEKCTLCGHIEKVLVDPDENAHNYGDGDIVDLGDGNHGVKCQNKDENGVQCTHTKDVAAHTMEKFVDEAHPELAPTCKADGYHWERCTVCDYEVEITDAMDENAHDMSAATPNADGTTHSAICSICGMAVTEPCVKGEHCKCICGRQFDHSLVADLNDKKSDATCAELAVYGTICADCGDKGEGTLTAGDYADHTWDETNKGKLKAEATCETGSIYYKYCSVCGKYADEVDHHKPAKLTWEDADKLGHNYNGNIHSWNNGTHSYECERFAECNSYGVGTEKNATETCVPTGDFTDRTETEHAQKCECGYEFRTAHSWVQDPDKEDIAPTCVEIGKDYSECSVCGYEKVEDIPVDPDAHSWDTSKFVMISDGKDGVHAYDCIYCDKTGTPEDGEGGTYAHEWSEGVVTKTPTCMEEGLKLYTCKAPGCGATYEEVLDKDPANHKDADGVDFETTLKDKVDSTCIKEGYSGDLYCNACNEIAKKGEATPVDPDAHRQEALTNFTGTPATCTEPGYADYAYCSDCKKTVSSQDGVTIIPALGHDYEGAEAVKVEGADKHAYSCTRECGAVKYENCYGGEATCKDLAVCDKCNEEYGETSDHNTEGVEWTAGGKNDEDVYVHVKLCAVCGEVAEEEACRGGNASCTEPAKCSKCAQEHKPVREHDFEADAARVNVPEDGKHNFKCKRCDVVGIMDEDNNPVIDGTIDCAATATEVRTEPNCTDNAYYTYTCEWCEYEWVKEYAEGEEVPEADQPLGHEYADLMPDTAHLYKEATCTEKAIYWYDCVRCDISAKSLIEDGMSEEEIAEIVAANTYEYGNAAGHNFNGRKYFDGVVIASEATCEDDATYYVYCSVCKVTSKDTDEEDTFIDYGSAIEHNWVEKVDEVYLKTAASCVAKAVYYKSCSVCGTKGAETFEHGEVLAHAFNQKIKDYAHRITAANCQTAATYWFDCDYCNVNAKNIDKTDMAEEKIAELKYTDGNPDDDNHISLIDVPVKNPTCTEAGHSAYKKCEACGDEIDKVTDGYEQLAHEFTGAYNYDATANTHKRACKNNCGTYSATAEPCVFSEWKQVANTETHSKFCVCGNIKTEECSSTTSTPSCTEQAICDACGGKFGETSDHVKSTVWTFNDDTAGYHIKECTVCHEVLETQPCYGGEATCGKQAECDFCKRSYGETPAHTYGEWIDDEERPATCTTAKWQYRLCTVCKDESTKQTRQDGSALGHNMSGWGYAKEEDKPTCKDEGIETNACSRCDVSETRTVPADPTLHVPGEWVKDEGSADCSTGIMWYLYCSVCEKKIDSREQKGEHNWVEDAVVQPSCITDGFISYVCDLCGFTKTEFPENLKARGEHIWGEVIVDKAPSCNKLGRGYQLCVECNAKSGYVDIPMLAHGPEAAPEYTIIVEPVAATCDRPGHNGYWKCKRCSYDEHLDPNSDYTVFPALGHEDTDGDGLCDDCRGKIYPSDDGGADKSCGCMCHNDSWLMQFFYKIAKFFWKLFGINKSCACGFVHY